MFSWYSDIFFGTKFKKIDSTRGWREVGSWLEVDLGSRLARVTPQLLFVSSQSVSNTVFTLFFCVAELTSSKSESLNSELWTLFMHGKKKITSYTNSK